MLLVWLLYFGGSLVAATPVALTNCNYMAQFLPHNYSSDHLESSAEAAHLCRRPVEGRFGSCCTKETETMMWQQTVDYYNKAYQNFVQAKLANVQQFLHYLTNDNTDELRDQILQIPKLLEKSGNFEKNDYWKNMEEFSVEAANTIQQLVTAGVETIPTLKSFAVNFMDLAESVVKVLIDRYVFQSTTTPSLMKAILENWMSQDDKTVHSLFSADKKGIGLEFIISLYWYNQSVNSLRLIENFWRVAADNEFNNRYEPHALDFSDPMNRCMLNLMQITKCRYCSVALKDLEVCPEVFENQTTCLAAFLLDAEKGYLLMMTYARSILMVYMRQYINAVNQFSQRYLLAIKKIVNAHWLDMLREGIQQYKSDPDLGLTSDELETIEGFMTRTRQRHVQVQLFKQFELPEVTHIDWNDKQMEENPTMSKASKFFDSTRQFSITGPLHDSLKRDLPLDPNQSNCWDGHQSFAKSSVLINRYNLSGNTYESKWAYIDQLANARDCILCLFDKTLFDCKSCDRMIDELPPLPTTKAEIQSIATTSSEATSRTTTDRLTSTTFAVKTVEITTVDPEDENSGANEEEETRYASNDATDTATSNRTPRIEQEPAEAENEPVRSTTPTTTRKLGVSANSNDLKQVTVVPATDVKSSAATAQLSFLSSIAVLVSAFAHFYRVQR